MSGRSRYERLPRPSAEGRTGRQADQAGATKASAGAAQHSGHDDMLSLQRVAGNRATVAACSSETIQRQRGSKEIDWLEFTRRQRKRAMKQAVKPFMPAVKLGKNAAKAAVDPVVNIPRGLKYGAMTGYGSRQAVARGPHGGSVGMFGLLKRTRPRKVSDLPKLPGTAAFFTGMAFGKAGRAAAWAPRKAANRARGEEEGGVVNVSDEDFAEHEHEEDEHEEGEPEGGELVEFEEEEEEDEEGGAVNF